MRVVIRIGGSTVASPPNPELIHKYARIIEDLKAEGHELVVIVGGGLIARQFITLTKAIGLSEPEQDEVAISVSRLFAQILAMKLGGLDWKKIPKSLKEVTKILQDRGIVVMGGVKPGWTTDTVAATIASQINANIIVKATDQDGIYTMDPQKHPEAKKLDSLSFDDLDKLLEEDKHKVGIHQIIDPEAIRILKKKHVKTIIVNGFRPENLISAVRGDKIGTVIK